MIQEHLGSSCFHPAPLYFEVKLIYIKTHYVYFILIPINVLNLKVANGVFHFVQTVLESESNCKEHCNEIEMVLAGNLTS